MRAAGAMVAAGLALGCGDDPRFGAARSDLVYGVDDRTEAFAHPDPAWRDLAENAVVALLPLDPALERGAWPSRRPTVAASVGSCPDEPFADQPSLAFCSGVLVDHDLVLTARHCVPSPAACAALALVFDYRLEPSGHLAALSPQAVFRCRAVVAAGSPARPADDFAFVRLDRPVEAPRAPAPLRAPEDRLSPGAAVTLLGFPEGAPLKITPGGEVRSAPPRAEVYLTSLDAFGGNSGSGVFDTSGALVGILVSGAEDYTSGGACARTVVRAERDGEEVVVPLAGPVAALEATGWSARRPGSDGACWSCRDAADCLAPLACAGAGPGTAGACRIACEGAAGCPAGAPCRGGVCRDDPTATCVGDEVWWRDDCGRLLAPDRACSAGHWCAEGACAPAPPGRVCERPLERASEDFAERGRLEGDSRIEGPCGGLGPELVYALTLERRARVRALATGLDSVLYVQAGCAADAAGLACNDDDPKRDDYAARIDVELEPGDYLLIVDSYDVGGEFELSVSVTPEGCGCTAPNSPRPGPASALAGLFTLAFVGALRRESKGAKR